MTMITAISVLMYMTVELPLMWEMQEPFCFFYHVTKIMCTTSGLFTVYFTLWYRVHTLFYMNPLLRQTTSKLAQVLNKLTVVLLICMTVANAVAFITSPLYVTTPIGCMKVQKTKDTKLKWGLLVSTTILFQILLLFSLIYPLNLHRKRMMDRGMNTMSTKPIIKRAAIVAIVCIASDATNAIYALTNKEKIVYVRHVVYGSNMLINMLSVLLSFSDWKVRLFPWSSSVNGNGTRRPSVFSSTTRSLRRSEV